MHSGVIITGGAKRVGASLARYFASKNYDVALHYNTSKDEALALQQEIKGLGVACEIFQCDLQNVCEFPTLMAEIKAKMPNVNTLINNASVFERAEFMETSEELFDRQFAVNFKAPFFLTQEFSKVFGNNNTSIINMLDSDIVVTGGKHFAYLLAKKTLAEFTIMAAKALGADIRMNGVCIGCALPSNQNDELYEEKMAQIIPLKKHPNLDEIAEAVYWLTQQQSITGQMIFVDGGKHIL